MSETNKRLGDLLRLERERRGLKLDKISGDLKIPETTLRAIEDGDPSPLPSELYFKLFAKSYAEHLGIDYTRTLEAMREELGETEPPDTDAPQVAKQPQKQAAPAKKKAAAPDREKSENSHLMKRLVIVGGVIIAGFVVFVAVYFLFLRGTTPHHTENAAENTTAQPAAPAGESGSQSLAEQYNWGTPVIPEQDSLILTLTAREASWTTVLADGDTALYQNLNPARVYRVAARYRLLVSIGVPRFVEVKLNDAPAFLADAESGRISRVEINQVNRGQFAAPPTATQPTERPKRGSAIDDVPDTATDTTGAGNGVENW